MKLEVGKDDDKQDSFWTSAGNDAHGNCLCQEISFKIT